MYQKILVPVDGSEPSNRALDEAIALAKLTKGQLRLFHVVDALSFAMAAGYGSATAGYSGSYNNDLFEALQEGGKSILSIAEDRVRAAGVEYVSVLHDSYEGRLADQVVSLARSWPADLIVIGTHGRRGMERLFMGSDAELIVRVAPVPVLLVRTAEAARK